MDEELGDEHWEPIASLLSKPKSIGRPRAEDRRTLNGILWVLRSGARWKDLQPKYGRPGLIATVGSKCGKIKGFGSGFA